MKCYCDIVTTFLFYFVILTAGASIRAQHIFDVFCEYSYGNDKKISFPKKVWNVSEGNVSKFHSCSGEAHSPVMMTVLEGKSINFGSSFQLIDPKTLKSINGQQCPSDVSKNYTLKIALECNETMNSYPETFVSNLKDCTMETSMMSPDCRPKCTARAPGGFLLDLRNLTDALEVQADNKTFSLSICGSKANPTCQTGVGSCYISGNRVVPLSNLDTEFLNYDSVKQQLMVRGRVGKTRVQILIKCNWQVQLFSNPIYLKPQFQGGNFKFEVESRYGCLKLPQKCSFFIYDDMFDISGLHKTAGDWLVENPPNSSQIILNICGPLRGAACSEEFSQVCLTQGNTTTNLGSILSELNAERDEITAVFTHGSICLVDNKRRFYSTHIKLVCSGKKHLPPRFIKLEDCVAFLEWETPKACPMQYYTGQKCVITNDHYGRNRNLNNLNSALDYVLNTGDSTISYNLCGPLKSSCNGFSNVSFCLKSADKESVLGWENRELISDKGVLRMTFHGAQCVNKQNRRVKVDFVCNFENPRLPPKLIVKDDNFCDVALSVHTDLACLNQPKFDQCVITVGNVEYDLSSLTRRNRNYIIGQSNGDFDFTLNICGPLITAPGAYCSGDAMICLRNKTAINVKHMYVSLGKVSGPRLLNGALSIESPMGSFCEAGGYYRSVINLRCSQTEELPKFVTQDGCTFIFLWNTKSACPKYNKCVVTDLKNNTLIDLSGMRDKALNVRFSEQNKFYEFNLCSDTYRVDTGNASSTLGVKRSIFYKNESLFLKLELGDECSNKSLGKVIFQFECNPYALGDIYKLQQRSDCVLHVMITTNFTEICKNAHWAIEKPVPIRNVAISFNYSRIVEQTMNCLAKSTRTDYSTTLRNLLPETLAGETSDLTIDSEKCNRSPCINVDSSRCPVVLLNHTELSARLIYQGFSTCEASGNAARSTLEIVLKCSVITGNDFKLTTGSKCGFFLTNNMPEACKFFQDDVSTNTLSTSTSASATIGYSVGAVGLFILFVVAFYIYKYRVRNHCMVDKDYVPVYIKNSRL